MTRVICMYSNCMLHKHFLRNKMNSVNLCKVEPIPHTHTPMGRERKMCPNVCWLCVVIFYHKMSLISIVSVILSLLHRLTCSHQVYLCYTFLCCVALLDYRPGSNSPFIALTHNELMHFNLKAGEAIQTLCVTGWMCFYRVITRVPYYYTIESEKNNCLLLYYF